MMVSFAHPIAAGASAAIIRLMMYFPEFRPFGARRRR